MNVNMKDVEKHDLFSEIFFRKYENVSETKIKVGSMSAWRAFDVRGSMRVPDIKVTLVTRAPKSPKSPSK